MKRIGLSRLLYWNLGMNNSDKNQRIKYKTEKNPLLESTDYLASKLLLQIVYFLMTTQNDSFREEEKWKISSSLVLKENLSSSAH